MTVNTVNITSTYRADYKWEDYLPLTIAKKARVQLRQYSDGILSHMQLKSTRYVILVSKMQFAPISDFEENGITYRHINIAVDPLTPSAVAKKFK